MKAAKKVEEIEENLLMLEDIFTRYETMANNKLTEDIKTVVMMELRTPDLKENLEFNLKDVGYKETREAVMAYVERKRRDPITAMEIGNHENDYYENAGDWWSGDVNEDNYGDNEENYDQEVNYSGSGSKGYGLKGEAKPPEVLRDPGAPTPSEIEEHNVTHLPFRSWCPHCVAGKDQDLPHKKREHQCEKQISEIVFDYRFLGGEDDTETLGVQVARDRWTQMLFAHVVPRKGMVHEHGAAAMVSDIERLGYKEVILKCDGEPGMKSVQEEVERRRMDPTILENSVPGDR